MKTSIEVPGALKKLSLIALAVALAGCSLSPRYERPQAPIAASYPTGSAYEQATPADADQVLAADIGWRDFFRDPLLQQLIALSLESNRDLQKIFQSVTTTKEYIFKNTHNTLVKEYTSNHSYYLLRTHTFSDFEIYANMYNK